MDTRVRQRVEDVLTGLDRSSLSGELLAAVVHGSAARGEEVWHGDELVSNIDLLLVARHAGPRLTARVARYRRPGVDVELVPASRLARYVSLSFCEARANGLVVRGTVDLARAVPRVEPADLPVWEAVRLLANRLVEHVRFDEGRCDAERVVAKSYEALAEANLVVEGRWRPSHAERLAEIERSAPDATPDELAGMVGALRARLGARPATVSHASLDVSGPPPSLVDVTVARGHLLDGFSRVAARYTGRSGSPAEQLATLARTEHHRQHRLAWAATLVRQGRWAEVSVSVDPVVRLWERALALVAGASHGADRAAERQQLLRDWRACPQVLAPRGEPG
jgi:predicted nucleotidyltransferase